MAESTTVEKQDIDDSLSSDEWTIIDKKDSKAIDGSDENQNEPKETVVPEDACQSEESVKPEAGNVEEGQEAGEKDIDSDDVSVISDENEELGSGVFEFEGRIQSVKWPELPGIPLTALTSRNSIRTPPPSPAQGVNVVVVFTGFLVIIAALIAGQLSAGNKVNPINTEMEEKLKGMTGLEEKLKELTEVKHVLDQLQTTMPDIKKLIDTLALQKYENNKPDDSLETLKKFEELYLKKILSFHGYDDRLEILEATYTNFCLLTNKINSSNITIVNEVCKTPKALADMIEFKRAVKRVLGFDDGTPSEKRVFVEAEKKLDVISESLLTDLATIFSKFTTKIEERLNKFGFKLSKRVCSLYSGKANDKLLNILISDEFFIKYCNDSSDGENRFDSKLNTSFREEKYHENKKKSHEELKVNGYKHDYKNMKDHKIIEDSQEDYFSENEYDKESTNDKSKGELKHDNNWKKNKYQNKEKYFQEERKYNKHEKIDDNYKNEYNKKNKEHFSDGSYEDKREEIKYQFYKNDRDYKYDFNKEDHEFKYEYEYEDNDPEIKSTITIINKRLDDDDKLIRNLQNDMDVMGGQTYKELKEPRYAKYQANERKNKKEKHQHSGEWQMERGKAREKLRNSDWYFVRADLRRQARSDETIMEDYDEPKRKREHGRNSHPMPPPSSSRSKFDRAADDGKKWRDWRPCAWWSSVKRNLKRFVLKDHHFF